MTKEEEIKMREWSEKCKHLPTFLRDFHDQKDVFKSVGEAKNPVDKDITWMDGHIYTIDKFLWFMAVHGYTLQKCRAKQSFKDIDETIKIRTDKEMELLGQILKRK